MRKNEKERRSEQSSDLDPEISDAMQEQSRAAAGRGPSIAKEERKKKAFCTSCLEVN